MRKKALLPALLMIVLVLLAGCSREDGDSGTAEGESGGDLLSRIQSRGTIIVATEGTWAPWTYHDENDELVGYDIEVAEGIAEHLGVKAEFV